MSGLAFALACSPSTGEVERPEKVVSKREVVYDHETYDRLATAWEEYYRAFPSEDAYANYMYAARYAGREDYEERLAEGVERYPANPTLLYLSGMKKHGLADYAEGRRRLERAAELEPTYMDPWFSLVIHYMESGDEERTDLALRYILEGAAVTEEVMDYSYNMLAGLAPDAILVTNGDNDTYPGWILTRLLDHRPDVRIVNRSLLNTSWYPLHVIEEGVPRFITSGELETLRETMEPPFSDSLIVRMVEAAEREGRPVYFALTLFSSPSIDRYMQKGRMLGLATLVTPPERTYARDLEELVDIWTREYRTGGLDSWRLRFAREGDAGRKIMINYPANICRLIEPLETHYPEGRLHLFEWYRAHCVPLLSPMSADEMGESWSGVEDIPEIRDWCLAQGYAN
jgi:hypothetical protein